jgi:probable HAF family extracellular repeat protein
VIIGSQFGQSAFQNNFLFNGSSFSTFTIDEPNTSIPINFSGINDSGVLVGGGDWVDEGGNLFTVGGPSSANQTGHIYINDNGVIAGDYNSNGKYHGFIDNGGVFTTLDDPNGLVGGGTIVEGINNKGDVVGYYEDSSFQAHGFVYSNGTFTTVDAPSAPGGGTILTGINDGGEIVGYTLGNLTGFTATPA